MTDSFERISADDNSTQLRRYVPDQKFSEIAAPLNTPVELLTEKELHERRIALDAISRLRYRAIPDLGVN